MAKNGKTLTADGSGARRRVAELQALLEELRPQLVAAEMELSERLAAIGAFEFTVRARLESLTRRLEDLEAEIELLRRELRNLQQEADFFGDRWEELPPRDWDFDDGASAAASGYRYHKPAARPRPKRLSDDQSADLKRLYRQLARRFHPDFALDEADRQYRTQMMMAINAAYTAGDLARLEALAEEPEPQRKSYTDEELAEALDKEVRHCRQRLEEITKELAKLEEHPSAVLMRRHERAAAEGRDLLDELAAELRDRIARALARRDVLQAEIEAAENGDGGIDSDILADAIYALGLEQALMEDGDEAAADWQEKNRGRFEVDDLDDDDAWEGLRRDRRRYRQ